MKKIGFIGIGVMGGPIIGHLLRAGYEVYGYTRTKAKAESLIAAGMVWCDTIALVTVSADVIFTMVGFPKDVEDVYFANDGIFKAITAGKYVVDLTTSEPRLAQRISKQAQELGVHALDAPVTGGDLGAINGTLTIMVGGEDADFDTILPILSVFGKSITLHGAAGFGQHAKMANQIGIAGSLIGMAEVLTYAQQVGLDPEKVLATVGSGSASSWQLVNNGPKAVSGDYQPGFYIKHFVKDMNIALDEISEHQVELPGLQLANEIYETLIDNGKMDLGTQAIIEWYKKQ
ncbi:NAD(P)-dependent oxidoreductase [Culicoidibacter larvae]|uniref:NAD(P)-dependent oxidoreductase n=1 Tax=Culicoidibacter larvae TaxID=2579976 RepID=A0A5R8QCC6_9FIRM|nr:NAD(P)-dependent oxidoreductase [Culicoidibacter larvae]TLG72968.1 NAD(P)-dependent oxidoreductase [Culicoidibacter larvae]